MSSFLMERTLGTPRAISEARALTPMLDTPPVRLLGRRIRFRGVALFASQSRRSRPWRVGARECYRLDILVRRRFGMVKPCSLAPSCVWPALLAVAFAVGPAAVLAPAMAAPGADGYIEGYAAAVLEREFRVTAPSLRVQNGIITVSATDLAGLDRARVIAALGRVRGTARVEIDRLHRAGRALPFLRDADRAAVSASRT
jgi:hypothetical protein